MFRKDMRFMAIVAIPAIIFGVGLAAVRDVPETVEPPRPPWVNPDGSVDLDRIPDRLPLFNEHGEIVGDVEFPRPCDNDETIDLRDDGSYRCTLGSRSSEPGGGE